MNASALRSRAACCLAAATSLVAGATVRAASVTWSAGSGTWDTTSLNWNSGTTAFTNGDAALFSSTAGGTVTIVPGIVPASTTVNATGGTYTFNGALGGGTFTKTGAGSLYLNSANTFSAVTLGGGAGAGSLYIGDNNSLGGAGTTVTYNLGGSTLNLYSVGNLSRTFANDWSITNNFYGGGYFNMTWTGTVNCNGTMPSFTFLGTIDIQGKVSNGGIAQNYNGQTLRLSNDTNDFTGRAQIWDGALEFTSVSNVGVNSALGTGANGIWIGGSTGTLRYIGTAPGGHATDRDIWLFGNAGTSPTIEASGTGPLVLNGLFKSQSDNSRNVTFGGTSTGANTVNAALNNPPTLGKVYSLVKSGTGQWVFTAANGYTGTTSVTGGTVVLSGSGAINSTSALSLSGQGTLTLDNTGTNTSRIPAVGVTMATATFRLLGNAAANTSQSTGALTLNAGPSTVHVANGTAGATSATLTFAGITRNAGGSVNFTATGGTLGAGGNNPGVVITGAANDATGILGSWATVNGSDWASIGANGVQAYSGYAALRTGAAGPEPDTFNSQLTGSQTQVAGVTTNTLKLGTSGTAQSLSLQANNLTLSAGALLFNGSDDYNIDGSGTLGAPAGKDLTVNIGTARTLTVNALVGTDSGLNKIGQGTLVLGNGANAYTGGTKVFQGMLEGTAATIKGALFVDTGATTVFNQGADGTFSSVISGGGGLLKAGTGKLTLATATNTFTGGTTIQAGTLEVDDDPRLGGAASGVRFTGDSTIRFAAQNRNFYRTTVIDPGVTATFYLTSAVTNGQYAGWFNPISGGGAILVDTPDATQRFLRFTNANSTWSGGLTLQNGAGIRFSADSALGAPNNPITLSPGTTFQTDASLTCPRNLTLGAGTVNFSAPGGISSTLSGNLTGTGATTFFLRSGGTLTLTGNNTWGVTRFNNQGAWLVVGSQANMGGTGSSFFVEYNAGNLRIVGANPGTFTAPVTISGGVASLNIDVADPAATVPWTGTFSGAANHAFTKLGSGALHLNATTNLLGSTAVSAGALYINNTTAVNQGSYTVSAGATLGGSGNIRLGAGKSVTVDSGGTLAPGASPGTLTVTGGDLVLASGSTTRLEFAGTGAGQFDALTVTGGTLNLGTAGDILDVTILAPYYSQIGDTFRIVNATSVNGVFDIIRWNGWTTGSVYSVAYDASGATLQFLVSIPEPATGLALALAAAAALRRRRR